MNLERHGSVAPASVPLPPGTARVLYTAFNQDFGCFAVGLQTGLRIYNTDPMKERMRQDFAGKGIGYVEMLFRTNYLALVGGGLHPMFPRNEVILWDDDKKKQVVQMRFRTEVKAVKLRRDRIVVVLVNKVFVYTFGLKPEQLGMYPTADNEFGTVALCPSSTSAVLAIPGRKSGQIHVLDIGEQRKSIAIIPAHESALCCIAINAEGTRIASASQKGTLVRVHDAQTGAKLNELRRGIDPCNIISIAFNFDSTRICVTSDKGSVHIFNIVSNKNRTSSLAFLSDVVPYFGSEWSCANFHVPEPMSIAAFGTGAERNLITVVCGDGSCFKYRFDPETSTVTRESYNRYIRLSDEEDPY